MAKTKRKDGSFLGDRDNKERCGSGDTDRRVEESMVTRYKQAQTERSDKCGLESESDNMEKEGAVDHRETKTICKSTECRESEELEIEKKRQRHCRIAEKRG